ncbi:hypothetical protein MC885_006435 [Smutsia gigantea]|nr:hypothetical protein MC885_006435 [Smutsia gigantea]
MMTTVRMVQSTMAAMPTAREMKEKFRASHDMPVVSLGLGRCTWSRDRRLGPESGCTDCAASSSAEMER